MLCEAFLFFKFHVIFGDLSNGVSRMSVQCKDG